MAERRMFALSIIDTDLFLDMPMTSQALYFHLAMRADDDGFVGNPHKIKRTIGASDDDMKLLLAKQFVIPFDTGVLVIKHWKTHNYIRPDRYKPTIYQKEKAQLVLDNNVYTIGIPSDNHTVTQTDTQVRLGKDRLGKDRKEGEKNEPDGSAPAPPKKTKTIKHKFGEYGHVMLTNEQHSQLIAEFGEDTIIEYVRRADEYTQTTGKTYKDYNLTIRNWISKDGRSGKNGNRYSADHQGSTTAKGYSKYATNL